jgi:hypothetical protein
MSQSETTDLWSHMEVYVSARCQRFTRGFPARKSGSIVRKFGSFGASPYRGSSHGFVEAASVPVIVVKP